MNATECKWNTRKWKCNNHVEFHPPLITPAQFPWCGQSLIVWSCNRVSAQLCSPDVNAATLTRMELHRAQPNPPEVNKAALSSTVTAVNWFLGVTCNLLNHMELCQSFTPARFHYMNAANLNCVEFPPAKGST